jgi:hypothetical protein
MASSRDKKAAKFLKLQERLVWDARKGDTRVAIHCGFRNKTVKRIGGWD